MKINLQSFKGFAPRINPRYLPEGMAQVCRDVDVAVPSLKPLRANETTSDSVDATAQTLHLYAAQTANPEWFQWDDDVDVVRGQIFGDSEEWTHYSGDTRHSGPRSTYASIGLTGSTAPSNSVTLGVPAPETTATISVQGDPPDEAEGVSPETRVYATTFVRNVGGLAAESAPSPPSDATDVYDEQRVFVSLPSLPAQSDITHVRVYRATAGVFLFVEEFPASSAGSSVEDNVGAAGLGEEMPSLLWSEPPNALKGLTNLPNGVVAGFVGRDVYFCEPYRPYAWPQSYIQSLDYEVVGFGALDTTLVALTTGFPYLLQGATPESTVVVRASIEQACVSKRSIVSVQGAVIYASPDGLVRISPEGSELVTRQVFDRRQWQAFYPASMHAYQTERDYVAFYDTGTERGAVIFNIESGEVALSTEYAASGFQDVLTDTLYTKADGDGQISAWQAGEPREATWRSKVFTMPQRTGFSCAHVESEDYPLTCRIYADGALYHEQTVTDRQPFRLPVTQARDWEVELVTRYEVFAAMLAQSMEELASG